MKAICAVLPTIAMIWLSSSAGAYCPKFWEVTSDDHYLLAERQESDG